MKDYFSSQRDHIFRNVEVLIYVFDAESHNLRDDMTDYHNCLEAIQQNSPSAKIFCLLHKMDLILEEQREKTFLERQEELRQASLPMNVTCFPTSIWDETLYKAWSCIVYAMIPNISIIESRLHKFCQICEADEVVLFERATFLVISHASQKTHKDVHRFEKISNIIKQFKLSCSKGGSHFQNMEVRNSHFSAFIDLFTQNTYVMVIMSDPTIQSSATLVNIKVARKHFEKYLQQSEPTEKAF